MIEVLNHQAAEAVPHAGVSTGRDWVLVLGQDQITAKAVYYAKELETFGVRTQFLTNDRSGFSRDNTVRFGIDAAFVPKGLLRHWLLFWKLLRQRRPRHIEIFPGAKPWHLAVYVSTAALLRIPILTWCRGNELLNWDRHHPVRRWVNRFTFRRSRVILLRELYMQQIVERNHLAPPSKLLLCHNSISLPEDPGEYEREPLVIFLNSFKKWRNPGLLVEAARIVADRVPGARFELVGATSSFANYQPAPDDVERQIRTRIEELGLGEIVKVLPFTNDAMSWFRRAAIFVLPADIVFCNFALLEAMAMRLVPIVADVEGADLIVEHGVSGFVVPRTPEAIAERIIEVLSDPQRAATLGANARRQVAERYNSNVTAANLYALYQRRLWTRQSR